MHHGKKGRKFGRKTGDRRQFIKGLLNNLIIRESIKTTEARAKEIKPLAEKLVTLAKKQDLASLRLLLKRLDKKAAMKIYHEIAPKYQERKGGYLRIVKLGTSRKRDGAPWVEIKFV
ncbi:MAG TPA: 50S ribosomal protein L17 [Candidatus Colwellbacteria bacterium]|jgi:large subunit ribosomal protein L17|nr:50S ribosomal protein L17 [Candidatus Colwellbacteria bacterium]